MHDLLIEVAPRRIRAAAIELEAAEAAIIENDDLEAQLRVRDRARRLRGCRRLRARDGLGPVHRGRARRAVRAREVPRADVAVGRRAEAPRAGGAAARSG